MAAALFQGCGTGWDLVVHALRRQRQVYLVQGHLGLHMSSGIAAHCPPPNPKPQKSIFCRGTSLFFFFLRTESGKQTIDLSIFTIVALDPNLLGSLYHQRSHPQNWPAPRNPRRIWGEISPSLVLAYSPTQLHLSRCPSASHQLGRNGPTALWHP